MLFSMTQTIVYNAMIDFFCLENYCLFKIRKQKHVSFLTYFATNVFPSTEYDSATDMQ